MVISIESIIKLMIQQFHDKLAMVSRGLTRWSRQSFGSVRREIKGLQQKLEELRGDPLRTGPTHVELKINERLVELYLREKIMWR